MAGIKSDSLPTPNRHCERESDGATSGPRVGSLLGFANDKTKQSTPNQEKGDLHFPPRTGRPPPAGTEIAMTGNGAPGLPATRQTPMFYLPRAIEPLAHPLAAQVPHQWPRAHPTPVSDQ